MKILHAVQELSRGGSETVVLALKYQSEARGHVVGVAAARREWSTAFGEPVFDLPMLHRRLHALPHGAWAMRRAIRALRPDIVHAHGPGMAVITALATGRGMSPPALVTHHGVPEVDYPTAARLLKLAGLPVVACGPGVATALERHGLSVRATVVNGVAPPTETMSDDALPAEFGIRPGRPILVSVGRLAAVKRHDRSIRALAALPGYELIILGEGAERPRLEKLATRLGVEDRLHLPGTHPGARAVMGASDAVVMTSEGEGLPLTLIEAMMSGTPIVATRVRGIAELLTHDETALLVPPGDEGALVAALRRTLDDPPLARRLAARARSESAAYTDKRMAASYLEIYRSLARGRDHG
jgi:glycosyltransferase involved in cell wall biosynthesis